ncbi:hypothetical protein V6C03_06635 [Methyloligella sp. 2.7D]|uniref:hypothetical protein n=1 Tax=unclassified Methyloligella TaxID=2625955 RepID=UPI00157BB7C9|nr:hypothetical protein [Methyloligella sp. GL2]QKP78423.1 hypothetical protein HT051_13815 [Methyloligella sp. GL2]
MPKRMLGRDWTGKIASASVLVEVATGLALVFLPTLAVRLLFGADPQGVGLPAAQLAGIALLALCIACWPARRQHSALLALFAYNLGAFLFLLYLGIRGETVGPLLWPAVILHGVFTLGFGRVLQLSRISG